MEAPRSNIQLMPALLLIWLLPALNISQVNIQRTELKDGVERWYRVKAVDKRPWFFQQIEELFKVALPYNDQLPFGVSVAFLVGVSEYEYLQQQLQFVKNDLNDMREFLLNEGGFDTVYVAREKIVNRDLIEDYMGNKFAKWLGERDRLLFYYSGHGDDGGGKTGYMQFAKARPDNFAGPQVLAINAAANWISEIHIAHLLFVFDCCASGLAFTSKGGAEVGSTQKIATLSRNGSRVVMTAGTAEEKTYEVEGRAGKGNGVFTLAFLNAVKTGRADKGNDGIITIEEIFAQLKNEVANFSARSKQSLTPRLWQLEEAEYRGTFVFVNPVAQNLSKELYKGLNGRPRADESLRSSPQDNLSAEVVSVMLRDKNLFDSYRNENCKGIIHSYKTQTQDGEKVIVDQATGLMWQQSGSSADMKFAGAQNYIIRVLNKEQFAGFSDWRLPTLEEATSLLEPREYDELYINPIFDQRQKMIWTVDKENASKVWVVLFGGGLCDTRGVESSGKYVRAVRSVQ